MFELSPLLTQSHCQIHIHKHLIGSHLHKTEIPRDYPDTAYRRKDLHEEQACHHSGWSYRNLVRKFVRTLPTTLGRKSIKKKGKGGLTALNTPLNTSKGIPKRTAACLTFRDRHGVGDRDAVN